VAWLVVRMEVEEKDTLRTRIQTLKGEMIKGLGNRIPFGIDPIDHAWKGIPRGKITTISGENNTGKTLLLHQLAVVNFFVNNSSTAFFNCDNDLKFNKATLERVILRYSPIKFPAMLKNLIYSKIATFGNLKFIFEEKIEHLVDNNVNLIMIDSINNLLDMRYTDNNVLLANFLNKAKQELVKHDIALLITNSAYPDPQKHKMIINGYSVFKGLSYFMIHIKKINNSKKKWLEFSFLEPNASHFILEPKGDGLHAVSKQDADR
jgi:archaellum biogenesis ATPase FlaH